MDANREYGRGNRARKQINYSDDQIIDEQVFSFQEFDEEGNNVMEENDYTPIEVPRKRVEREREREVRPKQETVDIDQIISKSKHRY